MKDFLAVIALLLLLPVSSVAGEVRYYKGTLDVVATSGRSCDKERKRHEVMLVVSQDDDTSNFTGYFGGEQLIIGRLSGTDAADLQVHYPYFDPQRGEGHRMELRLSSDAARGELHDRHLDAMADECNFDTARLELTRIDNSDEAGTQYQKLHRLFSAQFARSTALALVRKGQIVEAVEQFEKALEQVESVSGIAPASLEPYLVSLANGYVRLGRYDDFNRLFTERFARIKDQATRMIFMGHRVHALLTLGRSAMAREEFDQALKHFRQALEFDYRNKDVIAAIMSAYVRSGRHDEAISFLSSMEQRLEQQADKTDVRDAIALVYFKKAQKEEKAGRRNEAEAALRKAMQLDPNTVQYLITLARWRHKAGSFAEADELLKKGLERFRDDSARREIVEARGRLRQTEDILKKLRRRDG